MGNPIATVATTPVHTVPSTNFFFMPCMSAMLPRMGMSSAITRDATVSAKLHAVSADPLASELK